MSAGPAYRIRIGTKCLEGTYATITPMLDIKTQGPVGYRVHSSNFLPPEYEHFYYRRVEKKWRVMPLFLFFMVWNIGLEPMTSTV